MRMAIVHDWLTGMRGGEKCLEVFCEIFPDADIYTLLHVQGSVSSIIESHKIQTSLLQYLPSIEKRYRYLLPLMPTAVRMLDLSAYDFILSSSHCVAKGARGHQNAFHLCYCYTPMRYAWTAFDEYFGGGRLGGIRKWGVSQVMNYLRSWDFETNPAVNEFVAISRTVADRLRRFYSRDADVLYPPVDTDRFRLGNGEGEYYLVVSAFAPYKRVDVAVEAFNRLGRPLKVVGNGQEFENIRKQGKSNIEFLGWQDNDTLAELYAGCRAFIFPVEEDFGITPLEAQASGRPVIALGAGGALETVVAINRQEFAPPPGITRWEHFGSADTGPTGLYFEHPHVDSLVQAIQQFEKLESTFDSADARRQALRFKRSRFKEEVQRRLSRWCSTYDG